MSRQQVWASKAFAAIERVKSKQRDDYEGKYRSHINKFPSLLIQSGLAQSLAFMNTRDGDGTGAGADFVRDLAEVVGEKNLLERSRKATLNEYTRLADMTLGAATWFRRFAGELKSDDEGGE